MRRTGALSGQFHTALTTPEGSFWIATSLGLARHAPPVWRTPPELTVHSRHVGTLYETRAGELFAASGPSLLWRRNGRWQIFPTPGGITMTDMPDGIGELPDGRLLLNAIRPGTADAAHVRSRHGVVRLVRASGRPHDGPARHVAREVRIAFASGCARTPNGTSRLESFDGETFTTHYEAGSRWHLVPPRSFLIGSNGDVIVLPEQMGVGILRA